MDNWGKRPSIDVIAGNVAPPYIVSAVADKMLDDTIVGLPNTVIVEGEMYVVTHIGKDIEDEVVMIALGALTDHINNTEIESWTKLIGDYCVCSEDMLYAYEWQGKYHGPRIDINLTYYKA